jgi:hypothetical protein
MMPADQMGSRRAMDLSSSTRCTVDSRHSFGRPESETSPGVTIAAQSKNLDAHYCRCHKNACLIVSTTLIAQKKNARHVTCTLPELPELVSMQEPAFGGDEGIEPVAEPAKNLWYGDLASPRVHDTN